MALSTCLLLMFGSLLGGKFYIGSSQVEKRSGDLCWCRWGCCQTLCWPSSGGAAWCWRVRRWRAALRSAWRMYSRLCATGNADSKSRTISVLKDLRSDRLHRPDVHFGSILPVSQQLRGCVGGTATLGAEELRGERLSLQSVAQAKVCTKHHWCFMFCFVFFCFLFLVFFGGGGGVSLFKWQN